MVKNERFSLISVWVAAALVVAVLFAVPGCGKDAEQLRQQQEALLTKFTQLEARQGTVETQLRDFTNELAQARAQLEKFNAKAAAPKRAAPAKTAKKAAKKKTTTRRRR
ncbi:MAG: hypothetical protein NDJ90_05175 [Oligoflexia bacterium]|nr:hypothetical protein [Oligoflexia bacterium]